jgi:hypothetical protein
MFGFLIDIKRKKVVTLHVPRCDRCRLMSDAREADEARAKAKEAKAAADAEAAKAKKARADAEVAKAKAEADAKAKAEAEKAEEAEAKADVLVFSGEARRQGQKRTLPRQQPDGGPTKKKRKKNTRRGKRGPRKPHKGGGAILQRNTNREAGRREMTADEDLNLTMQDEISVGRMFVLLDLQASEIHTSQSCNTGAERCLFLPPYAGNQLLRDRWTSVDEEAALIAVLAKPSEPRVTALRVFIPVRDAGCWHLWEVDVAAHLIKLYSCGVSSPKPQTARVWQFARDIGSHWGYTDPAGPAERARPTLETHTYANVKPDATGVWICVIARLALTVSNNQPLIQVAPTTGGLPLEMWRRFCSLCIRKQIIVRGINLRPKAE